MTTFYLWQVIFALFLLVVATRSLPFLFARFMNENLNEVGKLLPPYIMLLLVIYEIDLYTLVKPPYGIPAFSALLLLTLIHLWLRNTFVSLIVATGAYIYFEEIAANYFLLPH